MMGGGEARPARESALAPVIYLPGAEPRSAPLQRRSVSFSEPDEEDPSEAVAASALDVEAVPEANDSEFVDTELVDTEGTAAVERESIIEHATVVLTRSLGRRGLSVAEARAKLRGEGLTGTEIDDLVDDFVRRGWLDDGMLAEQLVHSATTRQDMGTKAVKQLLQKRLVARDVVDAVIAELPDDDAERALEFATSKARSLVRYDDATAMRRLMGQLGRRGFGGSSASTAARTALEQARSEAGGSGVRFR